MNMEEKRKIDKLIVADIDTAIMCYEAKRAQEKTALEKKLLATPAIEAAVEMLKDAKRMEKQAAQRLTALGLKEGGYREEEEVEFDDYAEARQNAQIKAFERKTEAGKERIIGLKKSFALKLFAGNEEAQKLFELLAQELAKIGA